MTFTDEDVARLKRLSDLNAIAEIKIAPEMTAGQLAALLARLEAAERLDEYTQHRPGCVVTFREAGEPTPDGGYRTKIKGQWYQSSPINQEPNCDCGLDECRGAWRKAVGK